MKKVLFAIVAGSFMFSLSAFGTQSAQLYMGMGHQPNVKCVPCTLGSGKCVTWDVCDQAARKLNREAGSKSGTQKAGIQ